MVDVVRRRVGVCCLRMEKKTFWAQCCGEISPLTGGPERSFRLFVHLPDVVMVNGKHGEAVVVLVEERLGLPRRELVVVVVFSDPFLLCVFFARLRCAEK